MTEQSMIPQLPAGISTANASLPATYQSAKTALTDCAEIDECKNWSDKAMALAAYARMADDDELQNMCRRIQSRAVRRCGELLKQHSAPGRRTDIQPSEVDHGRSQHEAARAAGMSEHQELTAVRVANIPEDEFEEAVESDNPPTVTALAQQGKASRAKDEPLSKSWTPPDGFKEATGFLNTLRDFAAACQDHKAEAVANGVMPQEIAGARANASTIRTWLDDLCVHLKG